MKLSGSEFLNQGLNRDPALEAWSPNRWTTRELPSSPFEKTKLLFFPSSSQGHFVLSREQPFTSLGNQNPLLEFLATGGRIPVGGGHETLARGDITCVISPVSLLTACKEEIPHGM